YENPTDPFPEVVEAGPCYEGEALGHPLIPAVRCVRNDLRLGEDLRVLVMSGSDMAGKSTVLWEVGGNTGLAPAGGAGAAGPPAAVAAGGGGDTAHPGLAPGGPLALLRGAAAGAPGGGPVARPAAAVVPAGRDFPRHQLARPAAGGRGGGARAGAGGGGRAGDDARPVADAHRGGAGAAGGERPLRGPLRGRRHGVRLQDAPRRGAEQQRPGP